MTTGVYVALLIIGDDGFDEVGFLHKQWFPTKDIYDRRSDSLFYMATWQTMCGV